METEGLNKERRTRVKKIKLYPRALGYKGGVKNPGVAAAQKANWANPEWRAAMMVKRKLAGKLQKARTAVKEAEAEHSARETMGKLKSSGALVDLDVASELAMLATLEILRKPGDKRTKLAAARQILEWTRAKPAAKSEVTVNKAEEWLKEVTAKNDEGSTTEDA